MSWFANKHARTDTQKLAALDRSLALIEFQPDGTILEANANFCRTMGYSPAELVGKRHSLFVEPDYARSAEYQAFWRKLAGGAFDAGDYRRLRKDGSAIYLRATYNPVIGADGRVVSVLKGASDVTELRLRALETDAKMAALSRAQAIVEFTPNGEIIDANENFFAAMGYRREEVVGKHHRMFVEPAAAASEDYPVFWRKLAAGEMIVDAFRRVGKGGKPIWLQAAYCPVVDLDGRVSKVVKFAYDMSDLILLTDALSVMAAGDLRRRLEKPFVATFEKLRVDFNLATDNLNALLRGIAEISDVVVMSAEEIASASQDLTRRTESQAAALENSAAALTQVTAKVKTTAETARLANQVVGGARGEAERSGDIVGRAVRAMGGIETSSDEIGKIIVVIDEIAFQTNLLALNAGVEAARAGEAGRGFAVVASEVRALAQRSAEAAKQIKALISSSSSGVEAGVKLVRQTGEALGAIVAKVAEIRALVGDISAAAEEQNSALGEVNVAVHQMDQATQQNAAMAEETNNAVDSMKQQIQRLGEALGAFKLAGAGEEAAVGSRSSAIGNRAGDLWTRGARRA